MSLFAKLGTGKGAASAWFERMFNLNDPRWGRGEGDRGSQADADKDADKGAGGQRPQDAQEPPRGPSRPGNAPPDLDELWRDFNAKLGGLFGGRGRAPQPPVGGGGNGGAPEFKGAGVGLGLIGGVVLLIWAATGFFIVQEGQQAVITQFGRYHSTVGAGFNWRLPYPIQRHEQVMVTQIRSVDVGRDTILKATGLKESAMLTQDENIVDIKFAVQYRLNDARAYLFESKSPADAVVQAAETAVREVVGKMRMDAALSEERDQIAPQVRALMQTILDRYKVGIEVVGINLQQGGVRPPEQVQAAFDDVLKAGQERERAKNEAQAYANDVIPRAAGAAARLKEESEAYKARVVAQAQGDAQRFRAVYAEYQKAPQVMRDRMYLDTMQQIYSNVTKVMVESRQGSNLLYLPLDKLLQQAGALPAMVGESVAPSLAGAGAAAGGASGPVGAGTLDARGRDALRSRERDGR
ncbi:MAG: FtsH protease activity modulator HflK [Rhodoferax sp.]